METLVKNFIGEPFKTRYVHSDPSLLSLAIARKPDRLLSVAGYAPLDRCSPSTSSNSQKYKNFRSTISKIVFLTLLAVMLVGNFKLSEKTS